MLLLVTAAEKTLKVLCMVTALETTEIISDEVYRMDSTVEWLELLQIRATKAKEVN